MHRVLSSIKFRSCQRGIKVNLSALLAMLFFVPEAVAYLVSLSDQKKVR